MRNKSVNDAMKEIEAMRERLDELEKNISGKSYSEEIAEMLQEYAGMLILGQIEALSCRFERPTIDYEDNGSIAHMPTGQIIMRAEFVDRR